MYYPYDFDEQSDITFVDIDADSDLDAFIGRGDGAIDYFKNTGTASAPVFEKQTSCANLFNGVDIGSDISPAFADIDGDGDLDVFIGNNSGNIAYLINGGTTTTPSFSRITGTLNPFNSVDVGSDSSPEFVDIDDDGDLDAFIGNDDGEIRFFENTGSASTPSYTERTGSNSITNAINVGEDSSPEFADIDGDGDFDLVIGECLGLKLNVFENTGTSASPQFTEKENSENIYYGVDVGFNSRITFADIDGDGDMDAVTGGTVGSGYEYGYITYYENSGAQESPLFEDAVPCMVPYCGTLYRPMSEASPAPFFSDIDGDGDLELLLGTNYDDDSSVMVYNNTGTVIDQSPVFERPDNADNPFMVQETGMSTDYQRMEFTGEIPPVFVDIDGDGDLDVIAEYNDDTLMLFTNNGPAGSDASLDFTPSTPETNPFRYQDTSGNYQNLVIGDDMAPTFEDVDDDGDLDAVIGLGDGTIKYYQNTGTATAALFVEQTDANNQFSHIKVDAMAAPSFVDIDNDGDSDLFVGQQNGTFSFYDNISGSSSDSSSCFIDTVDEETTGSISNIVMWKEKIKAVFKKLF